jgi:hypothetical protein
MRSSYVHRWQLCLQLHHVMAEDVTLLIVLT